MTLMVGALYDALRSVNVDDDKARKAGDEVADFQKQTGDLKLYIPGIKGEVALLKWMLSFVLASNVAILFKVFAG